MDAGMEGTLLDVGIKVIVVLEGSMDVVDTVDVVGGMVVVDVVSGKVVDGEVVVDVGGRVVDDTDGDVGIVVDVSVDAELR